MKRKVVRWMVCGGLLMGWSLAGCRKAAEEEGAGGAGNDYGKPAGGDAYAPVMPDASGIGEEPRKLPREEGPRPDRGIAPPPSQPDYRVALPVPGKPGFVLNPFTNDPVDVRGIPPGTLVRDPEDPDADHKFRIPKDSKAPANEGRHGDLTEIPIPEIP